MFRIIIFLVILSVISNYIKENKKDQKRQEQQRKTRRETNVFDQLNKDIASMKNEYEKRRRESEYERSQNGEREAQREARWYD